MNLAPANTLKSSITYESVKWPNPVTLASSDYVWTGEIFLAQVKSQNEYASWLIGNTVQSGNNTFMIDIIIYILAG